MGNAIATAALVLTANNKQMTEGLNQASSSISAFSTKVTENLNYIGTGFTGFVTGQAIAQLNAFKDKFWEVAATIKATKKEADLLGLSFNDLQAFHSFGGVAAEDMDKGLTKLAKLASEAAGGSSEAEKKFRSIGIAVEDIKGKEFSEIIGLVGDKINGMQDPLEKIRASMDLAGKGGAAMIPFFSKGSAGIDEMKAKADQLGLSLGPQQVANVSEMMKAWKMVSLSIQGVYSQLVSALAPVLTSVANGMTAIWAAVLPVVQAVSTIISYSWQATVQAIQDMAAYLKEVGDRMQGVITYFKNVAAGAILGLAALLAWRGFVTVLALIRGGLIAIKIAMATNPILLIGLALLLVTSYFIDFEKALDSLLPKIQKTFTSMSDKVVQGANEGRAALLGEIMTVEEEINKAIKTFGMFDNQIKIFDLKAKGASPEQLMKLQKMMDTLQGMKTTEDMDPTAHLKKDLQQLDDLLKKGEISWNTYYSAVNKSLSGAESNLGLPKETKTAGAIMAGSTAAAEAVIRHQLQGSLDNDPQQRMNRILEEQRSIQQQQLDIQKKLLEAYGKDNVSI